MNDMVEKHSVLTIEEAAEYLRISRGLAYELAKNGVIPTVQLGRRKVVPMSALQRKLDGQLGGGGE